MTACSAATMEPVLYEALIEAHMEQTFEDRFDTKCDFHWYEGTGAIATTAAWHYRESPNPGRHHITIGHRFDAILSEAQRADNERRVALLRALIRHEACHAQHTPRDLKAVQEECQGIGIPFLLFNLFEDARIEATDRRQSGRSFGWATLHDVPTPRDEPRSQRAVALFMALVYREGDAAAVVTNHTRTDDADLFSEVFPFYERAARAINAWLLFPILREWIEHFPMDGQQGHANPEAGNAMTGEGGEGGEGGEDATDAEKGDLDWATELADPSSDAARDHDQHATQVINGDTIGGAGFSPNAAPSGAKPPTDPRAGFDGCQDVELDTVDGTDLIGKDGRWDYPCEEAHRVRPLLKRLFLTPGRPGLTDQPGRRIDIRSWVRGRPNYYRGTTPERGKPAQVALLIDCSGSMNGTPNANAKVLARVFSDLAFCHALRGHVILSQGDGGAHHQTIRLPMPDEAIRGIPADGGSECIANAIEGNLSLLRQCRHVFVFTDGQITDRAIDLSGLRARGIEPIGCYVGSVDMSDRLDRWFTRFASRETITELVDAMLGFVIKH